MPTLLMPTLLMIVLLSGAFFGQPCLGQVEVGPDPSDLVESDEPSPATQADVERWVAELDSDNFSQRNLATERLVSAGVKAVGPVVLGLESGSLEYATRAIFVLRELAVGKDEQSCSSAFAALEMIAKSNSATVARRARTTLAGLAKSRQNRALVTLRQAGAVVTFSRSTFMPNMVESLTVKINES